MGERTASIWLLLLTPVTGHIRARETEIEHNKERGRGHRSSGGATPANAWFAQHVPDSLNSKIETETDDE